MKKIGAVAFIFLLLIISFNLKAQRKNIEQIFYRAEKYYDIHNYSAALPLFKEITDTDTENLVAHYKLGICYLKQPEINDQVKSINHFEKVLQSKSEKIPNLIHYYLGDAYHKNEQIDKALKNYQQYLRYIDPNDDKSKSEVTRQLEICKNAQKQINNKKNVIITSLPNNINSENTEYAPAITTDESMLAFTSLNQKNSSTQNKEELKLAYKKNGDWSTPKKLNINISAPNIGTAGISPDGEMMLIFIGGVSGDPGNLFKIDKEGNNWSSPSQINNTINSKYLESTASITPDRNTIYFASNRPGGFGGLDIYKVEKKDGKWLQPVNLGPKINTPFDEDTPFIHPNQKTLFFTSNGHNTIGGQDIFKTQKTGNSWATPENLGYPINTTANDAYFTLTANGENAYFSSNRKGGLGGQDIYTFKMPKEEINIPLTLIKGRIVAGESRKPVPTKIYVIDNETGEPIDYTYHPNIETGNYLIVFPPGKNYDMVIEAEGYKPYTVNINIPNQTRFYELYQKIHLQAITQFGELVGQGIEVKNAFYDTEAEREKKKNESELIQNDSIDVYELMDAIISSTDTAAYEYLLDLMYKKNPIEQVNFDESNASLEAAEAIYFYEENGDDKLVEKKIGNTTILTLPSLNVSETAQKKKEQKNTSITYDKALLTHTAKVFFDKNESTLKTDSYKLLDEVLEYLNKHSSLGVEIAGYASNDGDDAYNQKLSNNRANAVLKYLHERDIPRSRIIAKGYGATNETNSNKEESRRVELRLIDLNQL